MNSSIASKTFCLSTYAIAGISYFYNKGSVETGLSGSFVRGIQSFAIVSIFDKAIRYLFSRNVENIKKEEVSVQQMFLSPFIEEGIYSGILLTQRKVWMIPRLVASLITGMTAARSLIGRVEQKPNQGFTPDTKIGFLWALSRELFLFALPTPINFPLLIFADSCVFSLAEVCPKKNHAGLIKFSAIWYYKVLSSAFFRANANIAAQTHGMIAPLVQHMLFNISTLFEGTISSPIMKEAK